MTPWTPFKTGRDPTERDGYIWLGLTLFWALSVACYMRFAYEKLFAIILVGMVNPNNVGLFKLFGLTLTVGSYFWLGRYMMKALAAPVYTVATGKLPPTGTLLWKRFISLNGVFASALVLDMYFFVLPREHGVYYLGSLLSFLFLVSFVVGSIYLGWQEDFSSDAPAWVEGEVATVARLVVRMAVWSNCLFAASLCFTMPHYEFIVCRQTAVQWALVGTTLGVFISRLGSERLPYVLGLAVSLFGRTYWGELGGIALSLFTVFVMQYLTIQNGRLALVKTWGFGLGQGVGGVVGGPLGFFFIGLEGAPMGAALGEAVAGLLAFDLAERSLEAGHPNTTAH